MKKTLQKELKFQALPNENSSTESSSLFSSPKVDKFEPGVKINSSMSDISQTKYPLVSKKSAGAAYSPPSSSSSLKKSPQTGNPIDDVNLKYLKHVVLKFLTCREYEVLSSNQNLDFK